MAARVPVVLIMFSRACGDQRIRLQVHFGVNRALARTDTERDEFAGVSRRGGHGP